MLQNVLSLARAYDMLPRGGRVLCAVSGGADSMCLLHLLSALTEEGGFQVTAAHFDHRLRGEESRRDAAFVAAWCGEQGIPCVVGEGDVAGMAARQGLGVEEAARQMRYAFLRETAARLDCARIATAHNADDNLETLLLHLTRGAGLHGLAGIPPRRGEIVRPLLTCPRTEILSYLDAHGVPHVEDSTNTDVAYARNRLRRQVVPVLRQLNPRLSECVAETMGYLRADNDYLNAQAAEACRNARWTQEGLAIEARSIARLPAAVAPRAVRCLLEQVEHGNTDCSAAHLNAVVELARGENPSAEVCLPHGRVARRVYQDLLLSPRIAPPPPFSPVPLNTDGETAPEGTPWRALCRPVLCPEPDRQTPGALYLARAALNGPLLLRPRQAGDEIALPHRGTKSLKKLLIDAKIPRREREQIPVLTDGTGVAAVAGFGLHRRCLAQPGQDAYRLYFWKDA